MKNKYLTLLLAPVVFLNIATAAASENAGTTQSLNDSLAMQKVNSQESKRISADALDAPYGLMPVNPNGVAMDVLLYEVKPGAVINDEVLLSSQHVVDQKFFIYVVGKIEDPDNPGKFIFNQKDMPGDFIAKWLKLDVNEIVVKPGENPVIKLKISVPVDAKPGVYEGALALEKRRQATNNPGITVAARVMRNVRITVTNTPQRIISLGEYVAKKNAEILTKRAEAAANSGPTWYYYVSIVLFAAAIGYYLYANSLEKKKGGADVKGAHRHEDKE